MVRIMITKYFLAALMLPTFILSQNKFGFVQSDRIRAEYEEFKEAEGQLMLEYQQINAQFNNMVVQLDSIKKAFESQRLMSSPDWRKEKEAEIQSREASIQRFQVSMVGPEGELSKRQQKLEFDILSKEWELVLSSVVYDNKMIYSMSVNDNFLFLGTKEGLSRINKKTGLTSSQ